MGQLVHTLGLQWPKESVVEGEQPMMQEMKDTSPIDKSAVTDNKEDGDA
jgi:hypothetical protein